MDFQPQIKYILPTGEAPLPFFMAYPDYPCINKQEALSEKNERNKVFEDFEYLRKTYPTKIGRYQRRVEEILDTMDYDGSMIYDEYPDRLSLLDLGNAVAKILASMDVPRQTLGSSENSGQAGTDRVANGPGGTGKRQLGDMEEVYLQGLAQVLVCNEIYRRRQKRSDNHRGGGHNFN